MNKFLKAASSAAVLLACTTGATFAHEDHLPAPAGHAPIGVMGDHRHMQGEWMFSYRYMRMEMEGLRAGGDDITPAQLTANFGTPVAPLNMEMDMHMFGAMYGLSDQITLMAMVPYISNSMDHLVVPMNRRFTTKSDGFGDVSLSAIVGVGEFAGGTVNVKLGISAPTGSIDERDDTPAMANAVLPYPMQLGSGTWDGRIGAGWTLRNEDTVFGIHYDGIIRFGENDRDYTLGDMHKVSAYVNYELTSMLSVSGRFTRKWQDEIDGADTRTNPMMVPTANPDFQGGNMNLIGFGTNYVVPGGVLKGHRFAAEIEVPIHENKRGVGLATDIVATIGWQIAL